MSQKRQLKSLENILVIEGLENRKFSEPTMSQKKL